MFSASVSCRDQVVKNRWVGRTSASAARVAAASVMSTAIPALRETPSTSQPAAARWRARLLPEIPVTPTTSAEGISACRRSRGVDVRRDVAGLVERRRAVVGPGHHGGLGLGGVAEPVQVVARDEHGVAGGHRHVVVADAGDAFARDQVLDLLGVRVAVHLVAAARREVRDAEDRLLGADGLARDEPADVHVDPPGLSRFGLALGRAAHGLQAGLAGVFVDDRSAHWGVSSGVYKQVVHNYGTAPPRLSNLTSRRRYRLV